MEYKLLLPEAYMEKLDLDHLRTHGLDYATYCTLIDRLLEEGKTTGGQKDSDLVSYARLNRQRMRRIEKTEGLRPDLIVLLHALKTNPRGLLVFTEGWCGDAAQIVPWINKMQEAAGEGLQVTYLLRDAHLEWMDHFLTNGTRSIPKAVLYDLNDGTVLRTWGPRPASIAARLAELKKDTTLTKEIISENLHTWYNKDKGQAIQDDFVTFIGG
ncbi:MAG: hypothetical protein RLZZ630_1007 [Bacteroidota bacterium]|jgi:hypothetical protein